MTYTHSVGLLWTRDLLAAETCTCQHTQETNIHVPCGIRTSNPSKGAAAHTLLRQRGHRGRRPDFPLPNPFLFSMRNHPIV